jgi:hypothetical protein
MALMEVEFDTKDYGKVLFEIDDYGTGMTVGSTPEERKKAYDILRETMNDETFIDDGYRNDDAVNCCIALHVLGYDPVEWFENFFDDAMIEDRFFDCDIDKFKDHVDRVCGNGNLYDTNYLHRWGPKGDEGAALGYVLD